MPISSGFVARHYRVAANPPVTWSVRRIARRRNDVDPLQFSP